MVRGNDFIHDDSFREAAQELANVQAGAFEQTIETQLKAEGYQREPTQKEVDKRVKEFWNERMQNALKNQDNSTVLDTFSSAVWTDHRYNIFDKDMLTKIETRMNAIIEKYQKAWFKFLRFNLRKQAHRASQCVSNILHHNEKLEAASKLAERQKSEPVDKSSVETAKEKVEIENKAEQKIEESTLKSAVEGATFGSHRKRTPKPMHARRLSQIHTEHINTAITNPTGRGAIPPSPTVTPTSSTTPSPSASPRTSVSLKSSTPQTESEPSTPTTPQSTETRAIELSAKTSAASVHALQQPPHSNNKVMIGATPPILLHPPANSLAGRATALSSPEENVAGATTPKVEESVTKEAAAKNEKTPEPPAKFESTKERQDYKNKLAKEQATHAVKKIIDEGGVKSKMIETIYSENKALGELWALFMKDRDMQGCTWEQDDKNKDQYILKSSKMSFVPLNIPVKALGEGKLIFQKEIRFTFERNRNKEVTGLKFKGIQAAKKESDSGISFNAIRIDKDNRYNFDLQYIPNALIPAMNLRSSFEFSKDDRYLLRPKPLPWNYM